MWTRSTYGKFLYLILVFLFSLSLISCEINPQRQTGKQNIAESPQIPSNTINITESPSTPNFITATPATQVPSNTLNITEPTSTPIHKATTPATQRPKNTSNTTKSPSTSILKRDLNEVPFSLIDDRLFIQMPAGAKDTALQYSIMSAEKSSHEQTRLLLEENGQKLGVLAQETFFYSEDMDEDIAKILKSWYGETYKYTTETIKESDGFKAIKISPDKIDTSSETVLVRGAFARVSDDTLVFIGVYVSSEIAEDKQLCIKQADRILESIQPGTRQIGVSAYSETIGDKYSINLNKNYAFFEEHGADFFVYYIVKITKVDEFGTSIGLYIGGNPEAFYMQLGIDESELNKTNDTILGNNVIWVSYPHNQNISAETIFILPDSEYNFKMHIFINAANEAELLQIKEMIKTLHLN